MPTMPTMFPALKLTYFDMHGRAGVIRKTLTMGGVPFVDERVPRDLTPLLATLPYGKVPVLEIDGATVVAETQAIRRYAARLAGMYPPPSEPLAAALIDELIDSFDDLFESLLVASFMEKDDAKRKAMREALVAGPLPRAMERLETRLATINKLPFFREANAAKKVYLHDLVVWDYVLFMRSGVVDHIPATFMDTYTIMVAMFDKVEASPSVHQPTGNQSTPLSVVPATLPTKLTLTYLDMPGRAEMIRLALAIGGVAFEDERLSYEQVVERKHTLPNGQVPVLTIGNDDDSGVVTLAQSVAILRYVGSFTGLYPVDQPVEAVQIDEVLHHLGEFYFAMGPSFMEADPVKKKAMREDMAVTTIPESLRGLDNRLAYWKKQAKAPATSPYAMGGAAPTIADLGIYSLVMFLKSGFLDHVPTTIVDAYAEIVKASEAVATHPRVQQWYAQHPMSPAV